MSQSAVLRHCYDTVFEILKKEGKTSKLYGVANGALDEKVKNKGTMVFLGVSDFAQVSQDKNGEKVFVDERQFPAPTYTAFILTILVTSEQYQDVLETIGFIIRYFKDNNTFDAGDYNWHGNTGSSIYMEPVIREPIVNRTVSSQSLPSLTLEYRIEAAINSEKGGEFRRVQTRDIRSKTVK